MRREPCCDDASSIDGNSVVLNGSGVFDSETGQDILDITSNGNIFTVPFSDKNIENVL